MVTPGSGGSNLALHFKILEIEKLNKEMEDLKTIIRNMRNSLELNRIDLYTQIKTEENYNLLLKSGMFWEFHPELSGEWNKDKEIILKNEKMSTIKIEELKNNDSKRAVIFTYKGESDPVKELDKKIQEYTNNEKYFEFIDANMDNPWVRIVVFGDV